MRKVITLDSISAIPQEEAICVFLASKRLSKVVSTESIYIRYGDKVLPIGIKRWAIRAISIMNNRPQYGILHPDDISKEKLFYSGTLTQDNFISKLQEWYPDDYEFFLWHPEALEGKWNKD
jgi:hypothetical protein